MPGRSQVFCGPFSAGEIPSYQAAHTHLKTQWVRMLSDLQREIIEAIMDWTVRFGYEATRLPMNYAMLCKAHPAKPATGYAGTAGIFNVSRRAFNLAIRELLDAGIVQRTAAHREGYYRYAIDYTICAAEASKHPGLFKRIMSKVSFNHPLSTIEGALAWVRETTEQYLAPLKRRKRLKSGAGNHSFPHKNDTSPAKAGSDTGTGKSLIEVCMSKVRSAADIAASVNSAVNARRDKLDVTRRKRMTLADGVKLFDKAWTKGQRARSSEVPPSRIVGGQNIALLKQQLLVPARGTDLDIEAFGEWCAEHWDAIGGNYFAKAKAYPSNPAFRYFIKCLETFTVAYQSRDTMDLTANHSALNLGRQVAAGRDNVERSTKLLARQQARIEALEAEVRETNNRLQQAKRTGKVEETDDEREMREELQSMGLRNKPLTEINWNDDEDDTPKKPRRVTRPNRKL